MATASRTYKVVAVPFTGLPWIEVDTADDLERAQTEAMPKIMEMGGG